MLSSTKNIVAKTICHHCGEDCNDALIQQQEKSFCCQGCCMVFEILQENGLSNFYQLEKNAGISLRGQKMARYEWLDDDDIFQKLIDYQGETQVRVRLLLPQIHCSACIYLLENLHKLDKGIAQSKVNFLKKEIQVTYFKTQTTLKDIATVLASIGYAPEINFSDLDESKKPAIDKTLSYQLGLAGFTFGNIMLLSFPEYLGLEEGIFQNTFGFLNILLAIPLVFYCGHSYLQSAWQGLKQRHFNIDFPISLGILTLFGRSLFEILTHTGAGYLDSLAGLVFFLLIGKWFQQKTYHHLSFERDYKSYFPIAANLIKDKILKSIPVNKLNIGDTILIRNQELIPADGILQKGKARMDYSFVTGEAASVSKNIGEKLYAGGRQMGEIIEVTLTKKVSQSYLTQLWNDAAFAKDNLPNASALANKVGRYFTFAILLIAFTTLFFWLPKDVSLAINAFTAVLIIACPCAVALSIPFTLGNTLRLLSKRGFYLKNTSVIENLSSITALVFDKTGTLTQTTTKDLLYKGVTLSEIEKSAVKTLAHQSLHPISRKIETYFKTENTTEVLDFAETPGQGIQGFVNGFFVEITKKTGAEGGTSIKINGAEKGVFSIKNQYRKGVKELVKWLRDEFILFILSGDNDSEKRTLGRLIYESKIHFNQSPKDKMDFIKTLQKNGQKVIMLGDGLNDAGALQQSDIGIVISENTNNFTPACDAILNAKQFQQIPQFFTVMRQSIKVVYAAYFLALLYNIVGLSFAVQGTLSPVIAAILMPLSSITIVAFGVGLTSYLVTKITALD